jgi:hypothetical protein
VLHPKDTGSGPSSGAAGVEKQGAPVVPCPRYLWKRDWGQPKGPSNGRGVASVIGHGRPSPRRANLAPPSPGRATRRGQPKGGNDQCARTRRQRHNRDDRRVPTAVPCPGHLWQWDWGQAQGSRTPGGVGHCRCWCGQISRAQRRESTLPRPEAPASPGLPQRDFGGTPPKVGNRAKATQHARQPVGGVS